MNNTDTNFKDRNLELKVYSVADACRVLTISKPTLYSLINSGKLPVIRLGRRTLVPAAGIKKLIFPAA